MTGTDTKLTIFRKDEKPIKKEFIQKLNDELDLLSFQLNMMDDDYEGIVNLYDVEFFTISNSAVQINLSNYIRGKSFSMVQQKLQLLMFRMQEILDTPYSYKINALKR